jgi:hypothetical protein
VSSTPCPQCARPVTAGVDEFCGGCGYPLFWDEPAEEAESAADMRRLPRGEVPEETQPGLPPFPVRAPPAKPPPAPQPPPAPAPEPAAPLVACPACQEPNPQDRVLCQRCGVELRPRPAPAPATRPPRRPGRRRLPVALLLVLLLLAAATGAGLAAWRASSDGGGTAAATTTSGPPPPSLTRVEASSISATASSELPDRPERNLTYSIRNTLDGNPDTAWNSDSDKIGDGVGATLTYRFGSPVRLARIELVNGYAKSTRLWEQNSRLREVTIQTDAGAHRAVLSDRRGRQRVQRDFGTTSTVTLRVGSIYPGSRYRDLALSDIWFYAGGAR